MDPKLNAGHLPSRSAMLEIALQLGLATLLICACFLIIAPFTSILLWSAVLAVMLYPLHARLAMRLGNRWSATLIGLVSAGLLLLPMLLIVSSLGSSIHSLISGLQANGLTIPPPPEKLADFPLVGPKLSETWAFVANNMPAAAAQYGSMLKEPAAWLVSFAGGLAANGLSFVLSMAIAAVLVAYSKGAAVFAERLLELITGSKARGGKLISLTVATIHGVALGVIGVAVIQALLLGIGLFAIGLPAAGLLTIVSLLLCIVQVPIMLLMLPVICYVFTIESTTTATIFTVWTIIAGLSDNILKPFMIGRGIQVPMPVILIGVIGGMLAHGLLGLFLGPVLLAVAYVLIMEWMYPRPPESELQIGGATL